MRTNRTKQKKVLMVLYYYHPYISGVSVCAKRVAEGLVRNGYKVTVLTSRFDKTNPKNETINGVNIVRRPVMLRISKGVLMPTFWLDIIRYARRNDYVNPHLPMAESGLSSFFIPKKKIITTYQCDIFLGAGIINNLATSFLMNLMRIQLMRSRVVVPSTRDYLEHSKMKKYLIKANPIYPTVPVSDFTPIDPRSLYKKLQVQVKDIKIGFVGRIVYEKGINYLLEAVPYLNKKISNYKIIIVGNYENVAGGSIKEQLDHYMGLYPDKIIFTGFLNDKERNQFYSGLDVFVLPSIDPLEAYGMVQVEAMLCGAPVVASNLPGVREIVSKTNFGRTSKIKNPEDIATQIIEVIQHPKKYKPLRQQVIKLFDPQESIEAYSRLMP